MVFPQMIYHILETSIHWFSQVLFYLCWVEYCVDGFFLGFPTQTIYWHHPILDSFHKEDVHLNFMRGLGSNLLALQKNDFPLLVWSQTISPHLLVLHLLLYFSIAGFSPRGSSNRPLISRIPWCEVRMMWDVMIIRWDRIGMDSLVRSGWLLMESDRRNNILSFSWGTSTQSRVL